MVRLYHYTDAGSLRAIKKSKTIDRSTEDPHGQSRDMHYGPGVYLTSMDPAEHTEEELAENNWQGGARARMTSGKLDHYVWIDIEDSDRWLEKCWTRSKRDVWLYKRTINLERFDWGSDSNSNWSALQVKLDRVSA